MTRKEMFSHLDKQVLAGLKLGVFKDRFGQKLLQLYQRGILDPWTIGQISNRVRKEIYKQAFSASPFKKHRLKTGDLILGFDEYGNPIKSFVQFMNSGGPYCGKYRLWKNHVNLLLRCTNRPPG